MDLAITNLAKNILPVRPSFRTEETVEGTVGVGQQRELDLQSRPVGGQPLRGCERDDDHRRITECLDVVAHGDHVLLARQSSEVAMQDQH